MLYFAAFLTGLLVGFIIKDRLWVNQRYQLTAEIDRLLDQLSKFVISLMPLTPDEFFEKFPVNTTGVGFVGNQMFLVKKIDNCLVTLTDYPLKPLLGKSYNDLRVTPFIPSESLLRDMLRRIGQFI